MDINEITKNINDPRVQQLIRQIGKMDKTELLKKLNSVSEQDIRKLINER